MVQKTSTFTSVIAASLVLLLGACPSISWSNTKIKDQITAQLTVRESKSKKIRNKSVVQRAKASIHRMTRRMAAQVHNLKKLLWGTGNFKNHYLRRIAGLSIIATGIPVTNDVLSQKDNQYQPVIPKVTPTSNEPDRTPLENRKKRVKRENALDTQLLSAIKQENLEEAKRLLNEGADCMSSLPLANNQLIRAFDVAIQKNFTEMVSLLLQYTPKNTNVRLNNEENSKQICAKAIQDGLLHIVTIVTKESRESHVYIIELLISHLKQYGTTLSEYIDTMHIGHQAIESGNLTIIQTLFRVGRNSSNGHVFFDDKNMSCLMNIIANYNRTDLLHMLSDLNIKLTTANKEQLFSIAVKQYNTKLIKEILNISSYEEIPFDELWNQYGVVRQDSEMMGILLRMRECALRKSSSYENGASEQEEFKVDAEKKKKRKEDIQKMFLSFVKKNDAQKVKEWLDIMKDSTFFISEIIKNAFIQELTNSNLQIGLWSWHISKNDSMFDLLLEHIPPSSDMLEIAKYAIDCGNFRLLHKLYDKQCAQPDQYLFFNDDGIKTLLQKTILTANRSMLKKLITTQPYNKISSEELWRSVFSMNCQEYDLARSLVEKRMKAEADDEYINIALNRAFETNYTNLFQWLLEHDVIPKTEETFKLKHKEAGDLLWAAVVSLQHGCIRILLNNHIKVLFEHGSNADMVTIDIWQRVIKSRNIMALELLLSHSDGIIQYANQVKKITQEVTLIPAPVTNIIIEYIVPADNACKLLKYAVQHRWPMGVSRLLKNKAGCLIMHEKEDSTLLDKAIENHDHETAEILIARGVTIHQAPLEKESDKEGLKQGNLNDLAQLLITKASLIGLEDEKRLEIAALAGLPDTIQPTSHD